MLTSINPLGERGRGYRWGWTVTLFTVASAVGGAVIGLALGALGELLPMPVWVAVVACLLAAAADVGGRVPSLRRQVDEDWLSRYRRWVYATGFGWQLGTGVTTIVTSGVTYALLALLWLVGLPTAVVAGSAFGLVRALPVLLGWRATTPDALRELARRIDAGRQPMRWVTVALTGLAAVGLALA
jgi:hypothetical protein